MASTSLSALAGIANAPDVEPARPSKKIEDAAKQFEALMISQMMKSARESSGGGWLSDGDQTGEDSSMGMAEAQFAQTMANNGGLGLAKMVIKTMTKSQGSTTVVANPGAASAVTQTIGEPAPSRRRQFKAAEPRF